MRETEHLIEDTLEVKYFLTTNSFPFPIILFAPAVLLLIFQYIYLAIIIHYITLAMYQTNQIYKNFLTTSSPLLLL